MLYHRAGKKKTCERRVGRQLKHPPCLLRRVEVRGGQSFVVGHAIVIAHVALPHHHRLSRAVWCEVDACALDGRIYDVRLALLDELDERKHKRLFLTRLTDDFDRSARTNWAAVVLREMAAMLGFDLCRKENCKAGVNSTLIEMKGIAKRGD